MSPLLVINKSLTLQNLELFLGNLINFDILPSGKIPSDSQTFDGKVNVGQFQKDKTFQGINQLEKI